MFCRTPRLSKPLIKVYVSGFFLDLVAGSVCFQSGVNRLDSHFSIVVPCPFSTLDPKGRKGRTGGKGLNWQRSLPSSLQYDGWCRSELFMVRAGAGFVLLTPPAHSPLEAG